MKFKQVYIEITNNCNLSCPFCPSSSMNQGEFLTVDKFKLIINNIKEYTKTVYFHVKGEPLLHNRLEEILDMLYNGEFRIFIESLDLLSIFELLYHVLFISFSTRKTADLISRKLAADSNQR